MPIYGWLQWAEKKCRKTHFPPQTAAAITPQEKEKASLHKGVCTHKYTFSVMRVNCRLGSLPAGPNREGAAYSSRGSPGPNVWLVTTKVTGTGYTQSYPSTPVHVLTSSNPTRDRCSKDMWSISTPYTNQIWWHMAIGSSSYCACLTEFLFQTSSSILSLDIQASKDGKTNNKTFRQADSRAGLPGPFFFFCWWRMLSAWIRLAYSSWASATSRASPLFTMETCPILALWLAHAIIRQSLCLTIRIIMALQQDDSRRRVMQKGLFPTDFAL